MLDETVEPGSQGDPAVSLSGKEHTLHNYRFKLFFAAPRFVRDCSHSACKMPSTTKEPSAHKFWLLIAATLLELICLLLKVEQKKSRLLTSHNLSDAQVRPEEIKEQLTEEDLDRRVDIYLTETETIWMLDMPSVVASVESEDAGRILYVYL